MAHKNECTNNKNVPVPFGSLQVRVLAWRREYRVHEALLERFQHRFAHVGGEGVHVQELDLSPREPPSEHGFHATVQPGDGIGADVLRAQYPRKLLFRRHK